ncbi:hypothetical protein VCHA40O237_10174 [Vibrio chagasii]|nr:hypothetical protein VCHA40O237_10174 [Vibrio chagasii]CAH7097030.1 hypothetical protein VCHA44O286_10238 [Vibrio chagasii]CAH7293552.1 hypothetical protein VCHA55O508_10238 [Vibrio chagasii]
MLNVTCVLKGSKETIHRFFTYGIKAFKSAFITGLEYSPNDSRSLTKNVQNL